MKSEKQKRLYGRIIKVGSKTHPLGNCDSAAVVFIFEKIFDKLDDCPETFDYSDVLIGPEIVEKGNWTRGYFTRS